MAWAVLMTGIGHCSPLQSRTWAGVSAMGIGSTPFVYMRKLSYWT
jgi:hypothetical protein